MANSGFWVVEFLQWLCGILQAPSFISLSHLDKNGRELWNYVGDRGLQPYRLYRMGQREFRA